MIIAQEDRYAPEVDLVPAEKDHDCVECGAPAVVCDLNADDESAFFCEEHAPEVRP